MAELSRWREAKKEMATTTAMVEQESKETRGTVPRVSRPSRGPDPKPDSERSVAKNTGIDRRTQRRAAEHVAVIERYPFLQRWLSQAGATVGT